MLTHDPLKIHDPFKTAYYHDENHETLIEPNGVKMEQTSQKISYFSIQIALLKEVQC